MPRGRPKIEFDEKDLKTIETFGRIKASYELMGDHFGCSSRTIARKMEDESGEFCHAYKRGLADTKQMLAQKQIDVALKGNTTMLIWLGKQLLSQAETQYLKHTGGDDGSIKVNFTVNGNKPDS